MVIDENQYKQVLRDHNFLNCSNVSLNIKDKRKKYLLFMIDTDSKASPFDINMAYESGYDMCVHFAGITPEQAMGFMLDLYYSRSEKNHKYTTIFLNGKDFDKVYDAFNKAKQAMGGTIKIPLVIDPRGAATTAASLVAKMKGIFLERGETLKNRKITILGGTGPVGRIAGALCNAEGADTYIVETWNQRNQEWVNDFILKFNLEYNVNLKGMLLLDETERMKHCIDKDLIISCGAAGIELLGKQSMEILSQNAPGKLCVDINLVPPPGIYGIKPDSDGQEIFPGMFGYGPLNIGQIKFQTEINILEEARQAECGTFDFNKAYDIAKKILKIK